MMPNLAKLLPLFTLLTVLACEKKAEMPESSPLCEALKMENYEAAGELIDVQAKTLTNSDWEVNIEELNDWFKEQVCVSQSEANHHIIETYPPQTEIIFTFESEDGGSQTDTVDLFFYEDGSLSFAGFHQ